MKENNFSTVGKNLTRAELKKIMGGTVAPFFCTHGATNGDMCFRTEDAATSYCWNNACYSITVEFPD